MILTKGFCNFIDSRRVFCIVFAFWSDQTIFTFASAIINRLPFFFLFARIIEAWSSNSLHTGAANTGLEWTHPDISLGKCALMISCIISVCKLMRYKYAGLWARTGLFGSKMLSAEWHSTRSSCHFFAASNVFCKCDILLYLWWWRCFIVICFQWTSRAQNWKRIGKTNRAYFLFRITGVIKFHSFLCIIQLLFCCEFFFPKFSFYETTHSRYFVSIKTFNSLLFNFYNLQYLVLINNSKIQNTIIFKW